MSSYDFPSIVAVKVIVQRQDRFLLLREPESNDWMPGRLGFPGGKLLLHESIETGLARKIASDIDFEVNVKGLWQVINILMPDRNVYHFVFLANYLSGEINTALTESKEMKWYTPSEIMALTKDDFTEYYNNALLEQLANQDSIATYNKIVLQDNRQGPILDWMERSNRS